MSPRVLTRMFDGFTSKVNNSTLISEKKILKWSAAILIQWLKHRLCISHCTRRYRSTSAKTPTLLPCLDSQTGLQLWHSSWVLGFSWLYRTRMSSRKTLSRSPAGGKVELKTILFQKITVWHHCMCLCDSFFLLTAHCEMSVYYYYYYFSNPQ